MLGEDAASRTGLYRSSLHNGARAPQHRPTARLMGSHLKWADLLDNFTCWNLPSAQSSWYYKFAIWGTIYFQLLHNFDPDYHYKIMLKIRREILKRDIINPVQRRHHVQVKMNLAEACKGMQHKPTRCWYEFHRDLSTSIRSIRKDLLISKHCFSPGNNNNTKNHGYIQLQIKYTTCNLWHDDTVRPFHCVSN